MDQAVIAIYHDRFRVMRPYQVVVIREGNKEIYGHYARKAAAEAAAAELARGVLYV